MMCGVRVLVGLIVFSLITFVTHGNSALAQGVPAVCKPTGSLNCVAKKPTSYAYEGHACNGGANQHDNEPLALEYAWSHDNADWPGCPPNEVELLSWADGDQLNIDFFPNCSGNATGSTWPQEDAGIETSNYGLYNTTLYEFSTCTSRSYIAGWVQRHRSVKCPVGYSGVAGSGYCTRTDDAADIAKNLGPACREDGQCSTGNPINTGSGNKYQAETDYVGSGPNPLRFVRFYNSLAGRNKGPSAVDGLYRFDAGTSSLPTFMNPDNEPGVRAIAVDAIGVNWRHSYHRAILESPAYDGSGGIELRSVSNYRPDGRVFVFVENNGSWEADADVDYEVTELTSGGVTTGWEVRTLDDQTETYSAGGVLESIASKTGITVTP